MPHAWGYGDLSAGEALKFPKKAQMLQVIRA